MALPRSRVPPWDACPVLRPRWCPAHSPKRAQDCGLPVRANRRLSPPYGCEGSPAVHARRIAGLNPAACLLVHSRVVLPLLGWHVECTPDLLARL